MNMSKPTSLPAHAPDCLNADRPPVIRNFVLGVDAFDIFKAHQRRIERETGTRLPNGQVLEAILHEYNTLRTATLDNPGWDFYAAYDAAIDEGVASDRLKEVTA